MIGAPKGWSEWLVDELLDAHAPLDWRERYEAANAADLMNRLAAQPWIVAAADIRKSTMLQKESRDLGRLAMTLSAFATFARKHLREEGVWFDKFTGDGFLAYAPLRAANVPGSIGMSLSEFIGQMASTHAFFEEVIMPMLRENVRNLPAESGLAIGLDGGPLILVPVADDMTILGLAVVGAVRMLEAARRDETICNIRIGSAIGVDPPRYLPPNSTFFEAIRHTKEYPGEAGGQRVYVIQFDQDASRRAVSDEPS